jgi:hypothetical protein
MTDRTHLDALIAASGDGLGKLLIEEFTKLARDPQVATASYPTKLRAMMDERLQAPDDAPA